MDTLVFLCQHTCTMVLPRWGAGLSSAVCDAVASSSDSASTEESSGHSGKVRRMLLLDSEQGDEGRRELKHKTATGYSQNNQSCVSEISVGGVLVFSFSLLVGLHSRLNYTIHVQLYANAATYCCPSGCSSAGQTTARCWFLPSLWPSVCPPSTSPSLSVNYSIKKTHTYM